VKARPVRAGLGVCAVVLATVGAAEVLTRLVGLRFPAIARAGPTARRLWVYDATKGWFHAPGRSGAVGMGGPDRGLIRINALGLRGPEVSTAKPPGVTRLLVFGDSFVFGLGVDEEHLFTTVLQELLNGAGRGRYEVINLGVSGYSTDQEYLLLQELGVELAPDLVLLVVCDNDFAGNREDFVNHSYKPYFETQPDGSLSLRNRRVPRLSLGQETKLWLGKESNLWNLFRSRRSTNKTVSRVLELFEVGAPRPSAEDPVRITAALVAAFGRLAAAAAARFAVINSGHRGENTRLIHELQAHLDREGVHFVDLGPPLGEARRDAPGRYWDFAGDVHWNVDAHRLAAGVVSIDLERYGLLPGAGASQARGSSRPQ
jgi:lysophospholipase L1-like esterase